MSSASVASGRHAGLTPGKIALFTWAGETPQRVTPNGVRWMHADTWTTYQRTNFVTPAFPGYISGHSTFSRSIAELLTAITGSQFFPGGLASYTITNLLNEAGPSQPVTLQWATYFDAADQVGLSRIWGGIHPPADDFVGRRVGSTCGQGVWALARKYFDGSVTNTPVVLAFRPLSPAQWELRCDTLRGFFYQLQSTSDLRQAFTNEPGGFVRVFDSSILRTNDFSGSGRFFRFLRATTQ